MITCYGENGAYRIDMGTLSHIFYKYFFKKAKHPNITNWKMDSRYEPVKKLNTYENLKWEASKKK